MMKYHRIILELERELGVKVWDVQRTGWTMKRKRSNRKRQRSR